MELHEIESLLEGILFVAGEPVPAVRIAAVLGVETDDVISASESYAMRCETENRGIRLLRLDDTLQLCSSPKHAELITAVLEKRKPPKLSQTALEILAIVAYFQPVTRAYIDKVRGVDSSYTVGNLADRGFIEICGRLDVPGRPLLYRTSPKFLRVMGLSSLEELPKLPEIDTQEGQMELRRAIDSLREDMNPNMRHMDNNEGSDKLS